jgi:predicted phage gp36 major capsid-like protein
MRIEKIVLEKSAEALLDRAADCFDLAKIQHTQAEHQHEIALLQQQNADKQHAIAARQHCDADQLDTKADKLDALACALEANAVEIMGDTAIVQRGVEADPAISCRPVLP